MSYRTEAQITWSGVVVSIQPRIRLTRSFDQRSHSYLGYVVQLDGVADGERRTVSIAITEAAHAKHRIQVGDALSGTGEPVADPSTETAELYKIRGFKVLSRSVAPSDGPPPWRGTPPDLAVYRSAAIAASQRGPTPRPARVASGHAGCRWRSSSTIGTRPTSATARRPSATARSPAGSTRPAPPARCPVDGA